MPLTRRVPKRGFNNHFKKVYATVNLSRLAGFESGAVVDFETLYMAGLIKEVKNAVGLKVLGTGEITVPLTVKASKVSASAKEAIEKVGGTCEEV